MIFIRAAMGKFDWHFGEAQAGEPTDVESFENQDAKRSEPNGNEKSISSTIEMANVADNYVATGEDDEQGPYDPYQHRSVKNPTTYFDTMGHLLKASLGTGILAMPSAFKNAGYLVGTLGMIAIGLLCTYCIHILIQSSYTLCVRRRKPSLTYAEIVEAAFEDGPKVTRKLAPYAKVITNVLLFLYQVGSSCVYVVFMASNIKLIVDVYFNNSAVNGTDVRTYMIYLSIPLIMISWLENLKNLSFFSTTSTGLTLISLALILHYIIRDWPKIVNRNAVGTTKNIPVFFGMVMFAMEAIGMVLPLENEMKNPEQFGNMFGVLNVSMIPICILYLLIGLLGYLTYGDSVNGSITLNIPKNEMLSQIVKIFLVFSISICCTLSNFMAFSIIWVNLNKKIKNCKYSNHLAFMIRVIIVLMTTFLAIFIPNLEQLISYVGSFCLSTVGITLPSLVNLLTYTDIYKKKGKLRFSLFCFNSILIILIGISAFALGIYININ